MLLSFVLVFPARAAESIKIALFEPLSGPFQRSGENYVRGVEFLADEINEQGGLLGQKIEVIAEDSQSKPDVAVRKAQKQVLEGVKIICNGIGTHIALALQQVAEKEKIISITYGGEGIEITGKFCNPYTFRVQPNAEMRSIALANFLATKSFRRFATINQDYAYGHDAAEGFKRRVKQSVPSAQIVAEEYHPIANKDFGPFISKIAAAKPELIFTGNYGVDLVNLIKQSRAMGIKVPFMSYNGHDPKQILPVVMEDAIGSFAVGSYMETVQSKLNTDFLKRWSQKPQFVAFQKWPSMSIAQSYNGMRFAMEAIRKAGVFEVPAIIKTWEGMKIEGLTGPMIMREEDHQTIMPVVIAEIMPTTNEFYPFPYVGKPYILPPEKTTVPLDETGCNRRKGQF